MTLLKKAKPEMAFLKMGIYGEAGSGKSFTSSQVVIGLHKHIKSDRPIAFLDTETGSDFVSPIFKSEKIELVVAKTRAFKDMLDVVDEAEKNCGILVIDSITHIWNEMCESYCRKNNLRRITLNHWQPVKQTWREFTKKYINSALHIIMAGRSADKWEHVEDEEGAKELQKVGTKMRSETEIGYEPSLLVEMEQDRKSHRIGGGWINRAWVIKDRFNLLSHKHFDFEPFEGLEYRDDAFKAFLPHIEMLNLGGKHRAIDTDRTSDDMFKKNNLGQQKYKKQQILLEEIKGEIVLLYPGQDAESKKKKAELLKEVFGTLSWTNVESMGIDDLHSGLEAIKKRTEKSKKETKK